MRKIISKKEVKAANKWWDKVSDKRKIKIQVELGRVKQASNNFDKVYPKIQCAICKTLEKDTHTERLVRDHDHETGIIRGWLCDRCNAWLGILERDEMLKGNKQAWLRDNLDNIEAHLDSYTGILYKI